MGPIIETLQGYEVLLQISRLITALRDTFVEVIDLFSSLYKWFKRHTSSKKPFMKKIRDRINGPNEWEKIKNVAENNITRIKSLCDTALREAGLASNEEIILFIRRMDERTQESSRQYDDDKQQQLLKSLLRWISPGFATTEDFDAISRKKLTGSCLWIENNPLVSGFLDPDNSQDRLLWITGHPGSGKTYIAAHLIELLLSQNHYRIAYCFCRTDDPNKRTALGILRAWALQLLQLVSVEKASLVFYHCKRGEPPTCIAVISIIGKLHDKSQPTLLILDGLDECDSENTKQMLGYCKALAKCFRIAVVSQNESVIRQGMNDNFRDKISHLEITKEMTKGDIQDFISDEVHKLEDYAKALNADLPRKISEVLNAGANGMFLWVRFMSEDLKEACQHGSEDSVKQMLIESPQNIDEYYRRTLDKIVSSSRLQKRMVSRTLIWVICGCRPLTRTELIHAISIDFRKKHFDRTECYQETILELCSHFIEVAPKTEQINLTHASVKDYLLAQETHPELGMHLHSAQASVARACLTYLCYDDRHPIDIYQIDSEKKDREQFESHLRVDGNHLLEYCTVYWCEHFIKGSALPAHKANCIRIFHRFASSGRSLANWLQLFCYFRDQQVRGSDHLFHVLRNALLHSEQEDKSHNVLKNLVQSKDFNVLRSHVGWAESGRVMRWEQIKPSPGGMPTCPSILSVASFFDFADIAKAELEHRQHSVNSRKSREWSPLLLAAAGDSVQTIQLLVDFESKLPKKGYQEDSPLLQALRINPLRCPERSVTYQVGHLLLEAGYDVNPKSMMSRGVMHGLLWSTSDSPEQAYMAGELIRKGFDMAPVTARERSCLDLAVTQKMPRVATTILDEGLAKYGDVGFKKFLDSALHVAIQDSLAFVPLLLSRKANPRAANVYGNQSLHTAARVSRKRIPRAADAHDEQPLHTAANLNLPEVIRILMVAGADTRTLNNDDETPIDIARFYGNNDVLDALRYTPSIYVDILHRWLVTTFTVFMTSMFQCFHDILRIFQISPDRDQIPRKRD